MKLNQYWMAALVAAGFFAGCCGMKSNSFVNDIEALVMDAEVNSESWDDDQWTVFESNLEGMMAGQYDEIKECMDVTQEKRVQLAYERGKDLLIAENPVEGIMNEVYEQVNGLFD